MLVHGPTGKKAHVGTSYLPSNCDFMLVLYMHAHQDLVEVRLSMHVVHGKESRSLNSTRLVATQTPWYIANFQESRSRIGFTSLLVHLQ